MKEMKDKMKMKNERKMKDKRKIKKRLRFGKTKTQIRKTQQMKENQTKGKI